MNQNIWNTKSVYSNIFVFFFVCLFCWYCRTIDEQVSKFVISHFFKNWQHCEAEQIWNTHRPHTAVRNLRIPRLRKLKLLMNKLWAYFSLQSLSLFSKAGNFQHSVCNDLIYRYGKWTHGTFEKMGIPGPKPIMYLGTLSQFDKVCTFFSCFTLFWVSLSLQLNTQCTAIRETNCIWASHVSL